MREMADAAKVGQGWGWQNVETLLGGGAQELGAKLALQKICCVAPGEVLLLWAPQDLADKVRIF